MTRRTPVTPDVLLARSRLASCFCAVTFFGCFQFVAVILGSLKGFAFTAVLVVAKIVRGQFSLSRDSDQKSTAGGVAIKPDDIAICIHGGVWELLRLVVKKSCGMKQLPHGTQVQLLV